MKVETYKGIVQDGHIKLDPAVKLREGEEVIVVVPKLEVVGPVRMMSPRLANPADAVLLTKEVTDE